MTKEKAFLVRISEEELIEFNTLLKSRNINRSALFREWIRDYIKENKNNS